MIKEGESAPGFTLATDNGGRVSLEDFKGKKVVLYFYPKDDTPGCTTQACDFRDSLSRFDDSGAVVLGVSPDPVDSHRKFKEKYDLTFPLLADEDHSVAERYGVWKKKKMFGRTFWGVERTTFLIDEEGRVRKVWNRVRPKGHAEEVAEALTG